MGGQLITPEKNPPVPAGPIELHFIQAKEEASFKETPVTKLEAFAKDMLSYDKAADSFTYLNSSAQDAITNFREKYSDEVMGHPHTLSVHFHYACKADGLPSANDKVNKRGEGLTALVKAKLSSAEVTFNLWNARKLHEAAKASVETTIVLPVVEHFSTQDGSTVCIVKLNDFAERLLTKEDGELQTRFLEPNVRDYNGKTNTVNEGIRATLTTPIANEDFWWLNNGITILAEECPVDGKKAKIKNPEIVNGLQTSHEVYQWKKTQNTGADNRSILVKVIVATDENTRSRVIKSTNSQTKVSRLSLMANEPIQEDIENRLRLYDLYYDRRKGEYRRLKKPIKSLVGMGALAQAFIAVVLQKPDQSRGRPETYVETNTDTVYDKGLDLDFYAASILIDRQVEEKLSSLRQSGSLSWNDSRNIRYYVDMLIGKKWALHGKAPDSIKEAMKHLVKPLPDADLDTAIASVRKVYSTLGMTDTAAKSADMTTEVLAV